MRSLEPFIDIHCHMLPGVDDGAADDDQACAMARVAVDEGTTTVVVTPHQLGQYAHNSGAMIRRATEQLQGTFDAQGIELRVIPGADVRIDDRLVDLLREGEVLTLGAHDRHVLLELPHELYFPIEPLVDRLRSAGLVGILSHPERNRGILTRPEVVFPLVRAGCLIQVTAGSLTGHFGRSAQRLAERLIADGLVHFVASDAHAVHGRSPALRAAFDRVVEQTDWQTGVELFCRNPARVAAGESVSADRPASSLPRRGWFSWSRRRFLAASSVLLATVLADTTPTCRAAIPWVDQRTVGPFRCHAGFDLHAYAGLLDDLHNLQSDLVRMLRIRPAETPIDIYLLSDGASYRELVEQRLPRVPYRRALYVKQGASSQVFVYRQDQLPVDLRHESTHALLHAVLDMVPLWLDEGLAEYFEVRPGQRVYGNPHLPKLKWNMRIGIIPSLASLEKKRRVEEMGVLEYRFSWAWVHFMLHGPARVHWELIRYLADIQAGTPPGRLSQRLADAIPDVEQRMVDHFKRWPVA